MVAPWIIWRYILGDTLIHTGLGLGAITLLLLVGNALRFLEDLVETGVALSGLGALLWAILPSYFSYAIPTALVFGVLVTFGRMSSDGEIVALRASGISVRRLLPAVLVVGLGGALASGWLLAEAEPRSSYRLKQVARELGKSARFLASGDFSQVGDRVLYTREHGPADCPLRGVLLGDFSDRRRPLYVTAACGSLVDGGDSQDLRFDLGDGSIHFSEAHGERYRRIRFEQMQLSVDVSELIARRARPGYYTTRELIELEAQLRAGQSTGLGAGEAKLRELWIELHRRIAFPVASIVLGIVAVPLGIRPLRAGRSAGALTAIAAMAAYWMLTSAGQLAAESGWVTPLVGIWAPNLCVLALGIWLLRRSMYADS
jgi:lipopolysaccharide export system permease protein